MSTEYLMKHCLINMEKSRTFISRKFKKKAQIDWFRINSLKCPFHIFCYIVLNVT